MRELKFKAWFADQKRMSGPSTIDDLANGGWYDHPNWILVQYTGFKTRHGKEIYEGDILCILEDVVADHIDGFNRYEQEGDFMEVVFDNYGQWSVKENSMVNGELLRDMLTDAQIIGNRYENPELLEKH